MRNKPVLLVEDDEHTMFTMKDMLDVLGVGYEAAVNGKNCIERLMQNPNKYGTILLDVQMPEMDGLEVVSYIRRLTEDPPRNIRIIAVTADMRFHSPEVAREAGFDEVVAKPVRLEKIREMVA